MAQQTSKTLISKLQTLSQEKQRAAAALLGSAVADAASQPLHWIYDTSVIEKALSENSQKSTPEFWPKSLNDYYKINKGQNSVYFDTSKVMINTLANQIQNQENKNLSDFQKIHQNYIQFLKSFYGDEKSEYQIALKKRLDYKKQLAETKGSWDTPVEGPWINGSIITFLDNLQKNDQTQSSLGDLNSNDPDGFCGALPLLLAKLSLKQGINPDTFQKQEFPEIEKIVRTLANNNLNVAFANVQSQILLQILNSEQVSETLKEEEILSLNEKFLDQLLEQQQQTNNKTEITQSLIHVKQSLKENHKDQVASFGKACPYPGNFKSALHIISKAQNYTQGVRDTILAGGDNCSRGVFVGAALGARFGLSSIPSEWVENINNYEQLLENIYTIFNQ